MYSTYRKPRGKGGVGLCSDSCKGNYNNNWAKKGITPSSSLAVVHVPDPVPDPPKRVFTLEHSYGDRVWVNGRCRVCGGVFTSSRGHVTCSDECSKANLRKKRREMNKRRSYRKRGAGKCERFRSVEIFERDGYRCHICNRMTRPDADYLHPRYPTIDHLVPLAKGGDHTRANVATACRLCNSIKGDRLAGDQLALI
ncbi:HNH endonuclease [Gordonia paraffinivorans]|uniref:HNH endonuclease n=1 Tax=Gordonia paraffinivorans TaxID=175628 RepID=UPI003FCCEE31